MSNKSYTKKRKFYNTEIPPVRPNTFSVGAYDNELHLSFAWVPFEEKNSVFILNRVAISDRMAESLAKRILDYLDKKPKGIANIS
jgi:hypothetical protein